VSRPARCRIVAAAVLLLAAGLLTGCASGSDSDDTATSSASALATAGAATAAADVVTVTLTVSDGKVDPATHREKVTLGQTVRLSVSSDTADEVHVHGYDRHTDLEPGQQATDEFVADQPGVFEVELEEAGIQLVQLEVR
jgi:hypothetical protein